VIELVLKVIEESTLYYGATAPRGIREHRVDHRPKEPHDYGNGEHLVHSHPANEREPLCEETAGLPSGSRLFRISMLATGIAADDKEMSNHVQWMREAYGIREVDPFSRLECGFAPERAKRVCGFSQFRSASQLADMLATILRRAFNNRLQSPGLGAFTAGLLIANNSATSFFLQTGSSRRFAGSKLERTTNREGLARSPSRFGNKEMLTRKRYLTAKNRRALISTEGPRRPWQRRCYLFELAKKESVDFSE